MCCTNHTLRPGRLSREEIDTLSRFRAQREPQIYRALMAQAYTAEWVGQDTLPGLVIDQPTPVAQPAVAKELVLA